MSGAEGYPLLVLDRAGDGRIAFLGVGSGLAVASRN